ncbi:MAG: DUF3683 domain-containing protein [Desulfobulbaceae bacterium]|jgi:FAD/FMN-containing dehydrogenase/Fe-S oxidoreductase|nr:DUF3683 domain-containing protein [Desulfobulbaceae bacterium]
MQKQDYREIPYNFTSADDKLIIGHLFNQEVWDALQVLRDQRITGRSARLVMRFIGDLFILRRNPFLYQELVDSPIRRRQFAHTAEEDLAKIEEGARVGRIGQASSRQVFQLVDVCRKKLNELREEIGKTVSRRAHLNRYLGPIIGKENISFDPFSLISHATDATDWRLWMPVAILRPSKEEQLPALMKAIARCGLSIIPRGGGTGLTGGAVPVHPNCVIVNTEKMNRIYPIERRVLPHLPDRHVAVLKVEAGVVTSDAMAAAAKENLVFATDPTSNWACTIGGNIAENAGGKTAVLWGTAIDNLLSFTIAMPGAGLVTVQRVGHPLRKILPGDQVTFAVCDEKKCEIKHIDLTSDDIRRPGLWKDITNKALGGVPGLQKEGTDGVITSAEFVLYPAYPKKLTFCLEFYGEDMDEASRVIVRISEEFVNNGEEALMALEHFDEEYIRAIQYRFKAARSEHPKAVLLIDMVGHTGEQIQRGRKRLETLFADYANTEVFIAQDADEAERFWRDRKRFGAIAARTNAFKLNEDIVLPLPALAEFSRYVDTYNLNEDLYTSQRIIEEIEAFLYTADHGEDPDWMEAKIPKAREMCARALQFLMNRKKNDARQQTLMSQLRHGLKELFSGYGQIGEEIDGIFNQVKSRRIVIATHMHAGDGNIHVNIPVFSNDRQMMRRAEKAADDMMKKAVELGGAVSGEHGIGITKMKFLEEGRRLELARYRHEVDPNGLMNPGMLVDPDIINKVFTPSFNLLSLEARILQHGSLEILSSKIAQCVRCGKCMAGCCVYYPGSDIFFHPRNKNMVIGSLIEALLYDMQRSHQPRFHQLKYLEEIADHCTGCGKCLPPCPVNIDTAEISVLEREILSDLGYKHTAIATRLSLEYLRSRSRTANRLFRKIVLGWGGRGQRLGHNLMKAAPKSLRNKKWRYLAMLKSPMPPASPFSLWDLLPDCAAGETIIFNTKKTAKKTVFYFPGCGSERLYGQVGAAALYILLQSDFRVVVPPPFLCCGFPARFNAKKKMHAEINLRDSIILSQIRDMLGYIIFDAFLVSCGTCRESLGETGVENIFDCPIKDVSGYVLAEGAKMPETKISGEIFYHAPCHDSLENHGPALLTRLHEKVTKVANCCSESGTLSLSRPDITDKMLRRKRDSLRLAGPRRSDVKPIITNCPSCLTGLGRNADVGIRPKHLAVLLAEILGGENWQQQLKGMLEPFEKINF